MVQAARSGKQNIAEGSMASATSKETELKLTNVARASLEELLLDYQDFLRTNKLKQWNKDHRLMLRFRELNSTPNATYETYRKALENSDPEICANAMICLIRIVTYLLHKQIEALGKSVLQRRWHKRKNDKGQIGEKKEAIKPAAK